MCFCLLFSDCSNQTPREICRKNLKMKKVKNIESIEKNTSLETVKEGKIKKKKQKKEKKLKDAVAKIENLTLKRDSANLKLGHDKPKNKKNKLVKQEARQEYLEETQKISNGKSKIEKQKKQKNTKKNKDNQDTNNVESLAKELTEAEIKKIEKKKAKKLAQKLKKQKNRERKLALNPTVKNVVKEVEISQEKVVSKNVNTTNKVLTKKEKKAQKRQAIKEQKLAEKQTRDPAVEAATVFVGNLPVNTKRVQLIRLFKDFGPVNSIRLRSAGGQVLHKHKQRKASGSLNAYVVLKNKEKAEKAVILNGVDFKGHHLRITLAAKNPQSQEKAEAKRTVFVGNLKYSATEESLIEIFSSCGEIDYVRCIRDGDKGCKGVAYVCFKSPDAVGLALELNETIVNERPINVERYSVKKLGAKEAREAQAEKEVKSKTGAKRRIDGVKGKQQKSGQKGEFQGDDGEAKRSKKSEFRGVKVEGLKKKQKSKKKKSNDQNYILAKKIAPKPKAE